MYNLRYHIASLVSVFLALAVGLVLGTIVVERGLLDAQKTTLVSSLTEDFQSLSAENRTLRADAEASTEFQKATVGFLVSGALEGRTIVLIATPERNDALAAAQEAVEAAGGTAAVVTLRKPDAGLGEPEIADRARSLTSSRDATGTAALESKVASRLADEWVAEGIGQMTEMLVEAGTLSAEDFPEDTRIDGVVLVASTETTAEPFALSVAEAAAAAGVPALGAEVTTFETDAADAAAEAGLAAVDHLDLPEGALSLVWVLSEGAKGYYGIDPDAVGRFPELKR